MRDGEKESEKRDREGGSGVGGEKHTERQREKIERMGRRNKSDIDIRTDAFGVACYCS